ncbi:biosynthetic-type acetolactate synthase large subunit [Ruminococcaceae bacterium OttesenSCG-928-D13]|nr:biosynthetic-type acetolactate synthase large subunit [Ruminococcaceae bacterium OttesenSCG-928-D13]
MRLSGAEIIAHVLEEQGADTVFGYPGGAVLQIYDALYSHRDTIRHHLTAHEQGAAHAADGYARATGKTGVVIATSGPGATNLVTGIATAFMDSVPMVAITGNVGSSLLGKDSFQEVYTMGITMPITKHNYTVQRAEDIAPVMREAFAIAGSGRKGPVLIDITKDATINEADFTPGTAFVEEKPVFTSDEEIWEILNYIGRSRRPVICFGGGVVSSEASQELYELVHKMEIPAVHTLMASGVLGWDDPLNLGLAGMHGFVSSNKALNAADLVLAIGFRFSDRVALNTGRFAPGAQIVQIDIDPSEIGKNVRVHHAVVGDIAQILKKLLPMLETAKHPEWLAEIAAFKAEDYQAPESETKLHPPHVVKMLAEMAGEDAVIVTDVGQHQMWAAQYCRRVKPRSFLTSGGLGTMGFGYGAAIGAQLGVGGRRVVHITGDGSFHMNLNEACTAVSYKLPIITVLLNNSVLGMVYQWQHSFYDDRYSATQPERKTDFVKLAEGFGATGYRATNPAEFRDAMEKAMASEGPVWIECVVDRNEMVSPMIPSGGTIDDMIIY